MAAHQKESVEEIVFELSPSPMRLKETRTSKETMQEVSETSFVDVGKTLNKSWDIGTSMDEPIELLQDEWEKSVEFDHDEDRSN